MYNIPVSKKEIIIFGILDCELDVNCRSDIKWKIGLLERKSSRAVRQGHGNVLIKHRYEGNLTKLLDWQLRGGQ